MHVIILKYVSKEFLPLVRDPEVVAFSMTKIAALIERKQGDYGDC